MIERILVPLDGSALSEQALAQAAALARLFGAQLILARVPEAILTPLLSAGVWVTVPAETQAEVDEAAEYLQAVAARPELAELVAERVTPPRPVADGLLDAVAGSRANLIVATTHGRTGLGRVVLGSIAAKLVHAAPVPVVLVPAAEPALPVPSFRRVLVPLDGSALAEKALGVAGEVVRAAGGELFLTRIPTVPGYASALPETMGVSVDLLSEHAAEATDYLEALAARLEQAGLTVSIDVELRWSGTVADGILASAQEHDAEFITMTTHGRTGLSRWLLGSIADEVVRSARLPVWLVRGATA
jgi:nucleotide-binding universal stress UspA family protein